MCCVPFAGVLYNARFIMYMQIVCLTLDLNYQWLHHNDKERAETDAIAASPD